MKRKLMSGIVVGTGVLAALWFVWLAVQGGMAWWAALGL